MHEPKSYQAIMVSSTFTDLKEHRQKVIEAIQKFGHKANVMEHDGARADVDVIDSSLKMVRDSAAYIGVISRKYGQTPVDPKRNPHQLSLTELEFNEAMRLDRPILLFIMGEEHKVKEADIELDPGKRKKLEDFRERAKRMHEGSEVNRIYEVFESLEKFSEAASIAVGRLTQHLASNDDGRIEEVIDASETKTALPQPPELAALPRYLGSHAFVGRASELQTLSDWCGAADPNPMLLFEAMGGSGKSMLTWEWLMNHAIAARGDWAGRFWYSFYEKGAVLADFCRQALAYMTIKPMADFAKLRTPALSDLLMAELEKHPWLVVLDGLERVLVAYHRYDAAQLPDEEADTTADQIAKRDPCAAIQPEDDELLRRLAAAAPSKILVTSRLTPLALVNRSGMPVPGVRREILPGLRPVDAEAMIRACGVKGRSKAIQAYLQTNCDCHPLVIGALAGLINNYPPDHGNFDRWKDDPHYGGAFNLADLNLVQRRNHILLAAIDALSPESRQLLQTLALLQGGANFETLKAFNPHLPPEPDEVPEPEDQKDSHDWSLLNKTARTQWKTYYEAAIVQRQTYLEALAAWKSNPAVRGAPDKLGTTIRDLEKRGLLQYDLNDRRYDLHPVVRGITAGSMRSDETQKYGQKVVDYFNSQPHDLWENAENLEDVAAGLQIVRVLLRMQRYDEALRAFRGDLSVAMLINLDARTELQALLKPFFPDGWDVDPVPLDSSDRSYLLNEAALSLTVTYPAQAQRLLERNLAANIMESDAAGISIGVRNLAIIFVGTERLAKSARLRSLALDISIEMENDEEVFVSKLQLFISAVQCGDRKTADRLSRELDDSGREWSRAAYRPGTVEMWRTIDLFHHGELTEEVLVQAETLVKRGRTRISIVDLHRLRGQWHLSRDLPARAIENLEQAVRMSREIGREDAHSEALLALARLRSGERFDARGEAERLSKTGDSAALAVAELWRALDERDLAVKHARCAHDWAAADGEPYVYRYYLDRARALLTELGEPLPEVPRYDPSKVTPYPWEKDVRAFIDKLRAERDAKKPKRNARKRKDSRNKNKRK